MSSPATAETLITGNYYDKYRSRNPLHRWMVGGFLSSARSLLAATSPRPLSVLEVGAGPGDLAHRLFGTPGRHLPVLPDYLGTDVCEEQVAIARLRYPELSFEVADACQLPFDNDSTDLVVACEILEHVADPARALAEIVRVSRRYVLISVPWEPVWRLLNMSRGKYLRHLGNTPGHVQHFTRREIRNLVRSRCNVIDERHPFPWTMLLAEKKR